MSTTSSPRKPDYKRCNCHANALGHHFGPDLRCQNGGCFITWFGHQLDPQPCKGLWVYQRAAEEELSL